MKSLLTAGMAMGASAAFGWAEEKAEKKSEELPTIKGMEPSLLYGGSALLLGLLGARKRGVVGMVSRGLRDAGIGVGSVATYKLGAGEPAFADDDDDDKVSGGMLSGGDDEYIDAEVLNDHVAS